LQRGYYFSFWDKKLSPFELLTFSLVLVKNRTLLFYNINFQNKKCEDSRLQNKAELQQATKLSPCGQGEAEAAAIRIQDLGGNFLSRK